MPTRTICQPLLRFTPGHMPVGHNAKFIPGYRHYDVVTAAEKRNSDLPEPASGYIANFLIQGR